MNTAKHSIPPAISAVICTRNRADSVVATLETVLANTHPHFEVVLVDQSTNCDTQRAIEPFKRDPRFTYIATSTRGSGHARNIGIANTTGAIIACTDDDCTVPPDWLEIIGHTFERNPRVGVVFCDVAPAPHDCSAGFIPAYERKKSTIVRTLWGKCRARGIGAGIALRRAMLTQVGAFDDYLGAGAVFSSCEDGDIAVRALVNGWWVCETNEVAVLHYGFRTWQQGKALGKDSWFGIGAAYSKPLRHGHMGILVVLVYEGLVMGLLKPLGSLLRLQKPHGLGRIVHFTQGFFQGLRTPTDRQMRFLEPQQLRATPAKRTSE